MENLLYIARIKSMAHRAYFTEVAQKEDIMKFTLYERAKIDAAKIPEFVACFGTNMKFTADARNPYFTYSLKKSAGAKARMGRVSAKKEEPLEILEKILAAASGLLLEEPVPGEESAAAKKAEISG